MSVLEALSRVSLSNRSTSPAALKPGTAIEATVLRTGVRADQANNGQMARVVDPASLLRHSPAGAMQSVVVSIRGAQVQALTDLPLQPGQRIALEVDTVAPQLVMRVVDKTRPHDAAAAPQHGRLISTLNTAQLVGSRAALQQPLSNLVGDDVAATIKPAVATYQLSELRNPTVLREAVARSGVAYERHLSDLATTTTNQRSPNRWLAGLQAGASPMRGLDTPSAADIAPLQRLQTDTKAQLLRQLAESRQLQRTSSAPSAHVAPLSGAELELGGAAQAEIKALESGLARIELNQLLSLHDQAGVRHPLRVEIPIVVDGEVRDLRLELDTEAEPDGDDTDGQSQQQTRVARVRLDLPSLGLVGAELRLREDALWVSMWAQQPSAQALLEERAVNLSERLQASGLPSPSVTILPDVPLREADEAGLDGRLPRGLLAVNV